MVPRCAFLRRIGPWSRLFHGVFRKSGLKSVSDDGISADPIKEDGTMSDHYKNLLANNGFGQGSAEDRRQAAVAAALALIHARVSGGETHVTLLRDEMSKLSGYAAQIQEALKVSPPHSN